MEHTENKRHQIDSAHPLVPLALRFLYFTLILGVGLPVFPQDRFAGVWVHELTDRGADSTLGYFQTQERRPLAGAFVVVDFESGNVSGATGEDGLFNFDIPEGETVVSIEVTKPGFERFVIGDAGGLGSGFNTLAAAPLVRKLAPRESTPRPNELLLEIGGTSMAPTLGAQEDDRITENVTLNFSSLELRADTQRQTTKLYLDDSLIEEGLFSELDEEALPVKNPDGTHTLRFPLLAAQRPAVAVLTVRDLFSGQGSIVGTPRVELLTSLLTDGIQGSSWIEGGRVRHGISYPDTQQDVIRFFADHGVQFDFERNLRIPSATNIIGPAFRGMQFQEVTTLSGTRVVLDTFAGDSDLLQAPDTCNRVADRLVHKALVYDAGGSLLHEVVLNDWQVNSDPSCGAPLLQNAQLLDLDRAATVYTTPEGRVELSVVDLRTGKLERQSTLGELAQTEPLPYFNIAGRPNAGSGSFLFDVPGIDTFQITADAIELGLGPERVGDSSVSLGFDFHPYRWTRFGESTYRWFAKEAEDQLTLPGETGTTVVAKAEEPVHTVLRGEPLSGCAATPLTLCLNDRRFAVSARYTTATGEDGDARSRALSNDSGTFWFFEPDNRELIVKALDGCAINAHFWLFAAGLTDVEVQLLVRDFSTHQARLYVNPLGRPYEPVLDIEAFPCSQSEIEAARRKVGERPDEELDPLHHTLVGKSDGTACGGDPADLCLNGGRFRVEVDYTDFAGHTSQAFGGNLTDDIGALFFFDRSNVEMLVKVLDACFLGNYWVFAAGLTNVGVDLRIIDTFTDEARIYTNPVGQNLQPITDTAAFGACP